MCNIFALAIFGLVLGYYIYKGIVSVFLIYRVTKDHMISDNKVKYLVELVAKDRVKDLLSIILNIH